MASALTKSGSTRRNTQLPSLNLPVAKLNFIIMKAREYDVTEEVLDMEDGTVEEIPLGFYASDPVRDELLTAIRSLNEEERVRLVALAWLGRGTYDLEEWREAVAVAKSEHSRRTAEYLVAMPLLAEYLEDGLALFEEGLLREGEKRPSPNHDRGLGTSSSQK